MRKLTFVWISAVLFILSGCQGSTSHTYTLENLEFELEGPLFEGPNSGQKEVQVDLAEVLKNAADVSAIKGARLSSCTIKASDPSVFDKVSSFVLQLTGDDAPMTEIAVLNPVVPGSAQVQLQPSKEAEVKDFFKQKSFIVLIDAALKQDQDDNLKFTADLTFELDVKE